TNQYTPCRPSEYYTSTQVAAQGTIQQILGGQTSQNRGPGNAWWADVVAVLQGLEQQGTPSSQLVIVSYSIDHVCNDLGRG
ncbi:MAG TPA: hypothetical protein VNJ51_08655, partial [Candidatus Dormibacteraeota bacterium]|nr:hypothetical protein [Candidatus Dormibacteraeota bacterium]